MNEKVLAVQESHKSKATIEETDLPETNALKVHIMGTNGVH